MNSIKFDERLKLAETDGLSVRAVSADTNSHYNFYD